MNTPESYDSSFSWKLYAWAIDFSRKLFEMGKIRKGLFRLKDSAGIGYGLENCEYHKEQVRLEEW
jgi:hypothetical protein